MSTHKINREKFFATVRTTLFGGKLKQAQVDGMAAILNEWERGGHTDLRWLAYMLGTAYHETGKTMQAVEEWGKGRTRPYGKRLKHSGVAYSKLLPLYYGRGHVQLTWYENYELMGRLLGVDLLHHPELALRTDISVKVMFEGMLRGSSSVGDFTGRCLEQYFNDRTENWLEARRIINGMDCAQKIKDESLLFWAALKASLTPKEGRL